MRCSWLSTVVVLVSFLPGRCLAQAELTPEDPTRRVVELKVGEPVEVPWTPGLEEVVVRVDLGEFDYNNVLVEQHGVDVVVTDPGGACDPEPWRLDLQSASSGTEIMPVSRTDPLQPVILSITSLGSAEPDSFVRLAFGEDGKSEHAVEQCQGWRTFLEARSNAVSSSREAGLEAVSQYESSAEIFRSIADNASLGQVLLNQASSEYRISRFDEALEHLSESRRLLSSSESAQGSYFDALNQTAVIYQRLGRTELAAALFRDAMDVAERLHDEPRMSKALNGLGLTYRSLDRWDEAIETYEKALSLAEGHGCTESAVHNNLGMALTRRGHFRRALTHLRRSIEMSRGNEDLPSCRHLAAALNSLGILYGRLGRHSLAAAAFEEALSNVDDSARLRLLQNFGFSLYQSDHPEQARPILEEAAELAHAQTDDLAETSARVSLVRILAREFEDLESARVQLTRIEHLVDPALASRGAALLLTAQAEVSLAANRFTEARTQASNSLQIARDLSDPAAECRALELLARSALRENLPEIAANAAQEGVQIGESFRSRTSGYDLQSSLLGQYQIFFQYWIEALLRLYQQRQDKEYLARSLEVAERARSRALLDMLHDSNIGRIDGTDPELYRLEERFLSLDRQRAATEPGSKERDQIDSKLKGLQALRLEREAVLRSAGPDRSLLGVSVVLDVSAMRGQLLDRQTALLYSFVGADAGWLWLLSKDDLSVWQIPGRSTLEAEVRRLLTLLSERSRSVDSETLEHRRRRIGGADVEYRSASLEFSRGILAPLLQRLDAQRILVVADGPLAYLPFGALPDPRLDYWQPLVIDLEWIQQPSMSVLASLRERSNPNVSTSFAHQRQVLAVLADPVFSQQDPRVQVNQMVSSEFRNGPAREFRRLPHTRDEAEALVALAGGDALLAVGFDATSDLVKSGQLAPYRILHFATHGVIDTEFPELSGLMFSQVEPSGVPRNGFLSLPDIYRLNLDSDLVVLSACETALGQEIRGEGLVGLTRGFMYAGASSVVASLWTVQDRATRELMTKFFGNLMQAGMSASAALHEAQKSMAMDDDYTPYHWAAFVIQGEWLASPN